jgi:hypothetical protein
MGSWHTKSTLVELAMQVALLRGHIDGIFKWARPICCKFMAALIEHLGSISHYDCKQLAIFSIPYPLVFEQAE